MTRLTVLLVAGLCLINVAAAADDGLVVKESPHDVATTVANLEKVLADKGITVFTKVDHAAGAEKVGLELPPTVLVVFGNPKLGTPLMQADRRIGIDLPMKALVWQDADGKTKLAYNMPGYLKQRHGIGDQDELFGKIEAALDGVTDAAVAE